MGCRVSLQLARAMMPVGTASVRWQRQQGSHSLGPMLWLWLWSWWLRASPVSAQVLLGLLSSQSVSSFSVEIKPRSFLLLVALNPDRHSYDSFTRRYPSSDLSWQYPGFPLFLEMASHFAMMSAELPIPGSHRGARETFLALRVHKGVCFPRFRRGA